MAELEILYQLVQLCYEKPEFVEDKFGNVSSLKIYDSICPSLGLITKLSHLTYLDLGRGQIDDISKLGKV